MCVRTFHGGREVGIEIETEAKSFCPQRARSELPPLTTFVVPPTGTTKIPSLNQAVIISQSWPETLRPNQRDAQEGVENPPGTTRPPHLKPSQASPRRNSSFAIHFRLSSDTSLSIFNVLRVDHKMPDDTAQTPLNRVSQQDPFFSIKQYPSNTPKIG